MALKEVSPKRLEEIYASMTLIVVAECEFVRDYVGGQPADDKGLVAFCKHHLKLSDDEIPAAVARIKREEIRTTSSPEDEQKEQESYGVCVVRRCEKGPYIGDHQIKAAIKCAASRIGLFTAKKGAKGDMAHLGHIEPVGFSRQCEHAGHIHLYTVERDGLTIKLPAMSFKKYMGSVQGPAGRVSIVHDSEVAAPGTRFNFSLRVPPAFYDETSIEAIFATLPVIGLGSVKALENGKFKVIRLQHDIPEKKPRKLIEAKKEENNG